MRHVILTLAIMTAAAASAAAQPRFFVLHHVHGPAWVDSLAFDEQPGIMEHVAYMQSFLSSGTLAFGGPFLDNSGGMMVFAVSTLEEAQRIAIADPTVVSGLLKVTVHEWIVPFSALDLTMPSAGSGQK